MLSFVSFLSLFLACSSVSCLVRSVTSVWCCVNRAVMSSHIYDCCFLCFESRSTNSRSNCPANLTTRSAIFLVSSKVDLHNSSSSLIFLFLLSFFSFAKLSTVSRLIACVNSNTLSVSAFVWILSAIASKSVKSGLLMMLSFNYRTKSASSVLNLCCTYSILRCTSSRSSCWVRAVSIWCGRCSNYVCTTLTTSYSSTLLSKNTSRSCLLTFLWSAYATDCLLAFSLSLSSNSVAN